MTETGLEMPENRFELFCAFCDTHFVLNEERDTL